MSLETITIPPLVPVKNTIIWLHGLGADGHDFVDIVPELKLPEELAVRFVFPHAPIRPVTLNNGLPMRAWFDIYGLKDESHIDHVGLAESEQNLQQLIQREHHAGVPLENIILAGFSQGGALALRTGLYYPRKLGGVISLSAFLPGRLRQSKLHVPATDIPILMAHGTQDPVIVIGLAEASRDHLIEHGYPVTWHSYPMAHSVCAEEIRDISAWLVRILSK